MAKESARELQSLLEGFQRTVQTLDQLVQPGDYKDLLLLDILCARLDPITRRGWEEYSSTKEHDKVKDLTEFLQRIVRMLGSLPTKTSDTKGDYAQSSRRRQSVAHTRYGAIQTLCRMFRCSFTLPMSSISTASSGCTEENSGQAEGSSINTSGQTHTDTSNATVTQVVSAHVSSHRTSAILLATAVVMVEGDDGVSFPARALLDSGSECNFMSERLCQQLKVQRQRSDVSVFGIGQATTRVRHKVAATVRSRVSDFTRKMEFLLLPKVTANLPIRDIDMIGLEFPKGMELADPAFFTTRLVDLVLGIQHFFAFFNTGSEFSLGEGLSKLTESVFGWIVSGKIASSQDAHHISRNMAVGLEEILSRFWSCEEVGSPNNYSPEEQRCEEQYIRTVNRRTDCHYTVSLPKDKTVLARLGESRDIANRWSQALERRLSREPDLHLQYNNFMKEYLELGHMRKVDASLAVTGKRCYLPHHPVIKQESTTTKVRVVFDVSCKTATGTSLNDTLLVGQLVVVLNENTPPIRWKMARIDQVHPGKDGVVRVVTLKTATGLLRRPVEKICILPSSKQDAE
ncbi:uncharacterized protein LOC131687690 [Topomyia yanbarensis]|uniref:uncharacterized protein LOC131687690 n=1 Tax=Topomyia yanbarensis TaxID=2498891 RepID=UPI00273C16DC|nr:uncharacterized protein LOC131687690 [Topomyia yanbarensis]